MVCTDNSAAHMSRLNRMIERLTTQRACLERAAALISDLPGPVLELGLGKGRTYDHLRWVLPEREIFVFDRDVHAPADCIPDANHLTLGDLRETLRKYAARINAPAALAHADIGSENRAANVKLAAAVSLLIAPLVQVGAVVLGDCEMQIPGWASLSLPPDAGRWPYFMYRVGGS